MVIDGLEKILAPLSTGEFFADTWGQTSKHVRGWPGKFSHMLPWDALNDILKRHRLDFPRLRLMQDGQRVPVASYIRHTTNSRQRTSVPRLIQTGLTKHLREGATLVLDAVDELYAPVEELAEALEFIFHEHVQVNLYAGWRTSRGFDLHWDDHDVFILQVAGRKRWSVYGMTRPHPVTGDTFAKPESEPTWQDTLEDGDLLYIPRGWWHVALPLDEPTLHLTVGIHNRTGLDLMRWLMDALREREAFRRDLPRFATEDERRAHLETLRRELLDACDDRLVERYLEDVDAMAAPRPRLSLPLSATEEVFDVDRATVVRLTAPRPVRWKTEGGLVEFACNGKRWQFAAGALAVLRPLAQRRICTVAELCEEAEGQLDERTIRLFIGELILHGLVAVVES